MEIPSDVRPRSGPRNAIYLYLKRLLMAGCMASILPIESSGEKFCLYQELDVSKV